MIQIVPRFRGPTTQPLFQGSRHPRLRQRYIDLAVVLSQCPPGSLVQVAVREVIMASQAWPGPPLHVRRWRYTHWPDGEELYDLTKDVAEHHNLARMPEQ